MQLNGQDYHVVGRKTITAFDQIDAMVRSLGDNRAHGFIILSNKKQKFVVTYDQTPANTFSLEATIRDYVFSGERFSDV